MTLAIGGGWRSGLDTLEFMDGASLLEGGRGGEACYALGNVCRRKKQFCLLIVLICLYINRYAWKWRLWWRRRWMYNRRYVSNIYP